MSLVGPRPLAEIHYKRDIEQGNLYRKVIKAGLLGLGHINKGTKEFGNSLYEFEYIDYYVKHSQLRLLFLDLKIIFKGIILILKGDGL